MTVLEQRFLELAIRRMDYQQKAEQEIINQLKAINQKLDILLKQDKQFMDTKHFFELNEQLSETLAKVLETATAIIVDFIDRHGKDNTVNIERFFKTPDNQERAEVIYVCREETDDYFSLVEEPLKTVTKKKDGSIWVNDEPMENWYNRQMAADLVATLEAIEEDVESGEASFMDGVLAYKEDETE